ncbi:MAG: hypothetical protein BWX84_01973 [Verrucomicrobia bacterium ADurb.Bin118]|nr:MAG: hypothetical protein BWX84_01973 [Verrucomicrobia bacterium ADurb.Bin118]
MRAGRQNLRDLAFDQFARSRLLDLIADGHFASRAEQPSDVTIRGVKRQAAHRHTIAGGEREVQQRRARLGVFEEHLVKIPQPKQQQCVLGQFAFDAAILRHHGRELGGGGHG